MVGRAVMEAAEEVRAQLLRLGARRLARRGAALQLEDGHAVAGDRRASYPELFRDRFGMAGGELIGRGVVAPGRTGAPLGGSTPFWEMAVGAAEVSLDRETGALTVEHYASVADIGRRINPLLCEGQDEGAVMQGLGHTLFEEMVYEGGQLLNGTLADYRVPRAGDLPPRLTSRSSRTATGPARSAPRARARARRSREPGGRQRAAPAHRPAHHRAAADAGARVARAPASDEIGRERIRRDHSTLQLPGSGPGPCACHIAGT